MALPYQPLGNTLRVSAAGSTAASPRNESTVLCDTTTAGALININLPDITGATIKDGDEIAIDNATAAFDVTITPAGTNQIAGGGAGVALSLASLAALPAKVGVVLRADKTAAQWRIVAANTGSLLSFLTSAVAAATYLTIATAAATYLTIATAAATYATITSLNSEATARKLGDGLFQLLNAVVPANWTAVRSTKYSPTWGGVTCTATTAGRLDYLKAAIAGGNSCTWIPRFTGGTVTITASSGAQFGFELDDGVTFNGWTLARTDSNWYRVLDTGVGPAYTIIAGEIAWMSAFPVQRVTCAAGATTATVRAIGLDQSPDGETWDAVDAATSTPKFRAFGGPNASIVTLVAETGP